jgi:hypothetical protein
MGASVVAYWQGIAVLAPSLHSHRETHAPVAKARLRQVQ